MSGELWPLACAEPERGGGLGHGELDPFGRAFEAVGEVAHQKEGSGPERREPERLRVPGAGSWPSTSSTGSGQGVTRRATGIGRAPIESENI